MLREVQAEQLARAAMSDLTQRVVAMAIEFEKKEGLDPIAATKKAFELEKLDVDVNTIVQAQRIAVAR